MSLAARLRENITKQDEEQKYDSSFPMKDRANIAKSGCNLPSPLTVPSVQIDEIIEDKYMLGNVHPLLGKGITTIFFQESIFLIIFIILFLFIIT